MEVVLASGSPRRREILTRLGIRFGVVVPEVEELGGGEPGKTVVENALRKARVAAAPGALAIGCDTDVVLDGRILGKPEDEGAARRTLEALSGRTHEVLSGLAIVGGGIGGGAEGGAGERSGVTSTAVTFRALDAELLDRYLASGEWLGKAGAYAIQGLGSLLVERIEGDFSNVVGLPLPLLLELAPEFFEPGRHSPSM